MSAKPATPLPWSHDYGKRPIIYCDGRSISDDPVAKMFDGESALTDAAYIVTACNAYPPLVAALRDAYSAVQPEMRVESRIKLAKIGDLLRSLGELE